MTGSRRYLPSSKTCFVCGDQNHAGLKTRFFVEDELVKTRITPAAHHCGYQGVVHGGVVAAMLDECMGWAAARAIERMCVTGELTVRYLVNVPSDRELVVETSVEKAHRLMVATQGRLLDDDGTVYATAKAKFLPLSRERTLEVDDNLTYLGDEERVFDRLRNQAT